MGDCNHKMSGWSYPGFRRVNAERGDTRAARLETGDSPADRTTRADMGDPALCWFNPPSAPSDFRSVQTGSAEFPICRVDESDHKSDLLGRKGR